MSLYPYFPCFLTDLGEIWCKRCHGVAVSSMKLGAVSHFLLQGINEFVVVISEFLDQLK